MPPLYTIVDKSEDTVLKDSLGIILTSNSTIVIFDVIIGFIGTANVLLYNVLMNFTGTGWYGVNITSLNIT